jgi:hypothetical protein
MTAAADQFVVAFAAAVGSGDPDDGQLPSPKGKLIDIDGYVRVCPADFCV